MEHRFRGRTPVSACRYPPDQVPAKRGSRKLRARTAQVGSSHFVGHRIPLYGSIIPGYASTYSFKRGTASESVSHIGKACVASDAALNPRITGNQLRLWETDVLDEIYTPGVFTEVCVPEAVSTDVLIGIRAGCFDPCPSFFQRLETTRLPSRSLRQLRQGVKQLFRPNGKRPSQLHNVFEGHIALAPLHAADIVAVQTRSLCQLFLGVSPFLTQRANGSSED